ncbi:hypothetical protein [Pyrococcus horikoshii]|uniref:Uncharacterized protein n=1 Tax=Pyrococcus horikoshii TaxID=53953 RepID=A0A832WJ08_PYRHR|nr:hypothetical protein [Pyrococcus horikoshii]HII60787.1 hypothetical protein [Pyrococcus horikoshii]
MNSRDILFLLTIIFVFISGYFGFRNMKKEAALIAGLAGGFALAFALYDKIPIILSFLIGFLATTLFEWSRNR